MAENLQGGCACGKVRYELKNSPLFVHACHCTRCQRETGAAYAVNILMEMTEVKLSGEVVKVEVPTKSGLGQTFIRCPECMIALWSHYGGAREAIAFVRAGTLDDASMISPDINIFTSTKLPHVILGGDIPSFQKYYRKEEQWPADSLKRYEAATANS